VKNFSVPCIAEVSRKGAKPQRFEALFTQVGTSGLFAAPFFAAFNNFFGVRPRSFAEGERQKFFTDRWPQSPQPFNGSGSRPKELLKAAKKGAAKRPEVPT